MSNFGDLIWNALPVPAILIDPGNMISEINTAGEHFLNASSRALRAQPVLDLLIVDAPIEDALHRARRDQATVFINSVSAGSGQAAPMDCNLQLAPVAGMPGFVLLTLAPRQMAGRLDQARNAKAAARSAIGMAEMLAHEIKNPLAGITGAAQLLSMNLPSEDHELTDLIVGEARRILALVDQVEQFGNLRPPERQVVNVHDLLNRARRTAELGSAAKVQFREVYDPSLPSTFVDGDQFMQVFLNILNNAAQAFENKQGTITLKTYFDQSLRRRSGDNSAPLPLQVEICDDGPGLPPDIADSVFDPFVSGRENGTGLGLALVSKIVADHGGLISVDSVPGRTVFRISLPLAPADAPAHALANGEA